MREKYIALALVLVALIASGIAVGGMSPDELLAMSRFFGGCP